jgi:hypothetical protein
VSRRESENEIEDDEGRWWEDILQHIDSTRFSSLFRNLVLATGLLRLREGSEGALRDLETIISETERYSNRMSSAKNAHPEVRLLEAIEKNLTEFSLQTNDFRNALLASELRMELELTSLCLLLSKSKSPEGRARKINLARKLKRLARHIRMKEGRPRDLANSIISKTFPTGQEKTKKQNG